MMTQADRDLVIVGSGVSGLTAARRAQQLGLRVAIAEKTDSTGLGNGRFSGGIIHAGYLDPLRPAEDLHRVITWSTDGCARPDLARAWADNNGRMMAFLFAEGARFAPRNTESEWNRRALLPFNQATTQTPPEDRWRGAGPDVLLSAMWQAFVAAGGDFIRNAPARELIVEEGAVVGIRVGSEGGGAELRGRSVLLADGGFHSNRALVKKYWGSDQYQMRASEQNTGDGLQMAMAIGAATTQLGSYYAHLQHRDTYGKHALFATPSLDVLAEGGLVVDGRGRRLGQTGATFMHLCDQIMRSGSPLDCWVVCDRAGWERLVREGGVGASLERDGYRMHKSDDLEDLARRTGVPADALRRSVEEHNRHSAEPSPLPESGEGLAHPPVKPAAISSPTYVAVPLLVGLTFGLGGVIVNAGGQVLNEADQPIDGLYAAGATMAGLQGGPNHGYAGGWSQACVFGLLVAEHVGSSKRLGKEFALNKSGGD